MVLINSSSGKKVQVEFIGISEVIRNIQAKQQRIISQSQIQTIQAANFIQQEVQESIAGNRAEPRSIDTGLFVNDIEVDMINSQEYVIKPGDRTYNNGKTTVQQVAKLMEYGTSKITPRRHFTNTKIRVTPKIEDEFLKTVNIALK